MGYIPPQALDRLANLKKSEDRDHAISLVNTYLSKDPSNEEALLHIADINYRRGEIDQAEKAVDFLNTTKEEKDPLGLYIKGVLAMEKLDRTLACDYLVRANEISDFTNHEIVRAYGWSQYWLGNREKGIQLIRMAHDINHLDAEVIYNLTELSLLERDYGSTREMLDHYSQYHDTLQTFDKPVEYYDEKMELFENYLTTKIQ